MMSTHLYRLRLYGDGIFLVCIRADRASARLPLMTGSDALTAVSPDTRVQTCMVIPARLLESGMMESGHYYSLDRSRT